MKVLKYGEIEDKTVGWKQTVKCGDTRDGCGAALEINHSDLFRIESSIPNGTMIMFFSMCPACGERIPVDYKTIPDPKVVPTHPAWLRTRRQALISQLYLENRNNWTTLRAQLLEDGIPVSIFEEINL